MPGCCRSPVDDRNPALPEGPETMELWYIQYIIFLMMGNLGFISSTVCLLSWRFIDRGSQAIGVGVEDAGATSN